MATIGFASFLFAMAYDRRDLERPSSESEDGSRASCVQHTDLRPFGAVNEIQRPDRRASERLNSTLTL